MLDDVVFCENIAGGTLHNCKALVSKNIIIETCAFRPWPWDNQERLAFRPWEMSAFCLFNTVQHLTRVINRMTQIISIVTLSKEYVLNLERRRVVHRRTMQCEQLRIRKCIVCILVRKCSICVLRWSCDNFRSSSSSSSSDFGNRKDWCRCKVCGSCR